MVLFMKGLDNIIEQLIQKLETLYVEYQEKKFQ